MKEEKKKVKERRRELRAIGKEEGLSRVRNDLFAEFVRRMWISLPRAGPDSVHKWAERFKKGLEWHKGDEKCEAVLLDILLEGPAYGKLGSFIKSKNVRDAIDKEKLEEVIEWSPEGE